MAEDIRASTGRGVGAKPWIKMRTDLWDDPRVSALCDALGIPEATVIGGLYRLWSIADAHSTDGRLAGLTADTLSRKTGLLGFAEALRSVGWLLIDAGGITIPDFATHNGQSAKQRAQAGRRKQVERGRRAAVTDASRNARDSRVTRSDETRSDQNLSTSSPSSVSATGDGPAWREVEGELSSIGLATAADSVKLAQKRGYDAAEVGRLIAHWRDRPGAWDVGAVVFRLRNALPGKSVDEGWPPPHDVQSRATSAPDDTVLRLRTKYGPDFGKLSLKVVAALAARAGVDRSDIVERGRSVLTPAELDRLLAQMAREAELAGSSSGPPVRDGPPAGSTVKPATDTGTGHRDSRGGVSSAGSTAMA